MWNSRAFLPPSSNLKRLIRRNGRAHLTFHGISHKKQKFLKDTWTTLIELQWRWSFLVFVGGFVTSWNLFAAYYFLIEWARTANPSIHQPCIKNVRSFTSALLFSIETQTTIGYGSRRVTESCPHVIAVVMLQSLVGITLQLVLAGIIVAKVKRGQKNSSTVFFSNSACIHQHNGQFQLAIRVADIRKSQTIFRAHARGLLIKKQYSKTGHLPVRYHQLKMTGEDGQRFLFTAFPTVIVHKIDQHSPLWEMSKDDFRQLNFEVVIIVEGDVTSTSHQFRTCASYLPWDICWGHTFIFLDYKENKNSTDVDYANFHKTKAVKMPWCSAHDSMRNLKRKVSVFAGELTVQLVPRATGQTEERHNATDTFLGSLTVINSRDWL